MNKFMVVYRRNFQKGNKFVLKHWCGHSRYWSHEYAWRALQRGRAQEQNPYNEYKFKHSVVKSIKEAT